MVNDQGSQERELADAFPPAALRKLEKGRGGSFTYVPVAEVIARLNNVLGTAHWDFEVQHVDHSTFDPEYIIARVRFSATIDGTRTVKEYVGGQKIKKTSQGDIVDLGDDFKGAVSDALKKAVQTVGPGLDLARREEAIAAEPSTMAQQERIIAAASERGLDLAKLLEMGGFAKLDDVTRIRADKMLEYIEGQPIPDGHGLTAEPVERIGPAGVVVPAEAAAQTPTPPDAAESGQGTLGVEAPTRRGSTGITAARVKSLSDLIEAAGVDPIAIVKKFKIADLRQLSDAEADDIEKRLNEILSRQPEKTPAVP